MTEPTRDELGRQMYELWCEWQRVAPPIVLPWEELSDDLRAPFMPRGVEG